MIARIALNTAGVAVSALPGIFQINLDAIEANPLVFATPDPTLAVCRAANEALAEKLNQINQLEAQLAMARVERDQMARNVLARRSELATYVAGVAKGDPAILLLGGFEVAAPPGPAPEMPKVSGNTLASGETEGTALGRWNPEPGAKSYEVAIAGNGHDGPWNFYQCVSVAQVEISGQVSGQKLWSRVRAVNKNGRGPWSDPACCRIG